jgi:hypothetical protein
MNTKKFIICLLVAGVISACGVTNSKKFNPHIDGYYGTVRYMSLATGGSIKYFSFAIVDYPTIHGCYMKKLEKGDSVSTQATKEDLKVAHKKGDIYKIITDNGNSTSNDAPLIKIKLDTTKVPNSAIPQIDSTLSIGRIKSNSTAGAFYGKEGNMSAYNKCRQIGTYAKNVF